MYKSSKKQEFLIHLRYDDEVGRSSGLLRGFLTPLHEATTFYVQTYIENPCSVWQMYRLSQVQECVSGKLSKLGLRPT